MNSKLRDLIEHSNNIVFFGGAGVSTESGIPDFRGTEGLSNQKHTESPEIILSSTFFLSNPHDFYAFYRDKILHFDAKPNNAHKKLAELEACGKLKAVITQNIDGLHQAAGSKNVLELHGSVLRNHCMTCGAFYGIERIRETDGVSRCLCGGIIKPDVVLYGENLPTGILDRASEYIARADMLIVGGTSLVVYPAAGLVNRYHGSKLVLINKEPTPFDNCSRNVFCGSIGSILGD